MSAEVVERTARARALWLALPVVLVVVLATGWFLGSWSSSVDAADPRTSGTGTARAQDGGRTVTGTSGSGAATSGSGLRVQAPDVSGLRPGLTQGLLVTVTNAEGGAVRLDRVEGEVREVADRPLPPGCPLSSFTALGSDARGVVLEPDASTEVAVQVAMPETGVVQDACQDVSFALVWTATGEEL